ncbi:MAG: hypothetical protein ABMA64_22080 [Myxococcota bacterium]
MPVERVSAEATRMTGERPAEVDRGESQEDALVESSRERADRERPEAHGVGPIDGVRGHLVPEPRGAPLEVHEGGLRVYRRGDQA